MTRVLAGPVLDVHTTQSTVATIPAFRVTLALTVTYIPARHATRVDPQIAWRLE